MSECVQPYYMKDGSLMDCSSFQMGLINEGKSIYEVARLHNNRLLFSEDHLHRLFTSLQLEGIDSWLTKEEIISTLENLISNNPVKEGNIKFVVNVRSHIDRHFFAYFVKHRYPSENDYEKGVKITTFPFERTDPNKKVWRPEFRREVAELLSRKQAFEALLIDSKNSVPEASKSNVFAIIDNTVITPPDDLVLPGITRKYVLKACREMGIQVRMRTIQLEEIERVDGLFLSGTSIHVLPVCQVNDTRLSIENEIILKIINQFQKTINS